MTKYLWLVILGLVLACSFPAPHGSSAQENQKKSCKETMITFTQKDDGGKYQFSVGQSFQVILPENPTTGYRWMVAEPADKPNKSIILLRQKYTASSRDPALVGSGGTRRMIFRTVKEGLADLVLILKRPWETEGKQIDSFNLSLDIHK